MSDRRIDAWLLWDFRGSNHILAQLFPPPPAAPGAKPPAKRWTTRRVVMVVPARGEPVAIVHSIDASQFDRDAFEKRIYLTWQELQSNIRAALGSANRVAMEYSPGCQLPVVSVADAGAVELIRAMGVDVVSSADLIQVSVAAWSAAALENHLNASRIVTGIKDQAFAMIRGAITSGKALTEREVQTFILQSIDREHLEHDGEPVVALNAHAGDPHFEVSPTASATFKKGDWVLIDLWARMPTDANIHSDITWVGCCGTPTDRQARVFNAVKAARDASMSLAQDRWKQKQAVQGWELDDAAHAQLVAAGFREFIRHRTGHSLSPGPKVHGVGVNLDNLETHDTRELLPNVGFTIEPGLYLPDFGVRLEINAFVDPLKGPILTSCIQAEPLMLA